MEEIAKRIRENMIYLVATIIVAAGLTLAATAVADDCAAYDIYGDCLYYDQGWDVDPMDSLSDYDRNYDSYEERQDSYDYQDSYYCDKITGNDEAREACYDSY